MRSVAASCCLLACVIASAPASAADCPGNPRALGTSRTIVVDPAEHPRLGSYQYAESLPLNDREVVLTFDDGPLPPYTNRVLDVLARECVKATFFMVGQMARTFPRIVRRAHAEGHNVASHSQTHPYSFYRMTLLDAAWEIDQSFEALSAALGDDAKVAPFFRFPGLHRQDIVEQYLASKGKMIWSVDFMGDDWTRIGSGEIIQRVLSRLEAQGKGILMLHDIKPTTAAALQTLLGELKKRGFRIVHVIPATDERPKTATTSEQWRVAHPPTRRELSSREPSVWPRASVHKVKRPAPDLEAPSPTNFGAGTSDGEIPVALVAAEDPLRSDDRKIALRAPWPDDVTTSSLPQTEMLPIPAAETFRYFSTKRVRSKRDKAGNVRTVRTSSGVDPARPGERRRNSGKAGAGTSGTQGQARPKGSSKSGQRQSGHQIQLPSPDGPYVQRR